MGVRMVAKFWEHGVFQRRGRDQNAEVGSPEVTNFHQHLYHRLEGRRELL